MAPFYAAGMWLLPPWRRYTRAVLPFMPWKGTILEIGPGPGLLQGALAGEGRTVLALDLSMAMLARTRARRLGARLVQGDAIELPLRDACLAAVAMTFVFSAIPEGEAAAHELARVLAPGGVVAIVDACLPKAGGRIASWLARQWERFGDSMRDEARLLASAGLAIETVEELGAFDSIRLTVARRPA
jgi:ubiquinone/menaquinone biosynthesis C-methylase UbiE